MTVAPTAIAEASQTSRPLLNLTEFADGITSRYVGGNFVCSTKIHSIAIEIGKVKYLLKLQCRCLCKDCFMDGIPNINSLGVAVADGHRHLTEN